MSDLKAAITADGNERIESQAMKIFYDFVRQIVKFGFAGRIPDRHIERISLIGRPQDGAANACDSIHLFWGQMDDLRRVDQALIPPLMP